VPSKRGSILMEDLAALDAINASANRQVGPPPIPVVTRVSGDHPASGADAAIVSDPHESTISDHFRMSSPNRREADTKMRHRRVKR
jgi:hypothetical protein